MPLVYLDNARRAAVEQSIRQCCAMRGWELHALSVRTNHAHVVISIGEVPVERALTALKGNATRVMRELNCWHAEQSPWSGGGSTKYLWKEKDVAGAVSYVIEGQGDLL